jgi:hypothetical protein
LVEKIIRGKLMTNRFTAFAVMAVVVAAGLGRAAQADTILTQAEAALGSTPSSELGYTIGSSLNLWHSANGYSLYSSNIDITATDLGTFKVTGFDIAVGSGSVVTFTGLDALGGVVATDTFTTGSGSLTAATFTNLANQSISHLLVSAPSSDWSATFADISLSENPIPEPTTMALFATALVPLALRRRRARRTTD